MPVPTSKAQLLSAIDVTFTRLLPDLAKVPPAHARDTTLEGHAAGTMMRPSDLVAYLIGWNELVLKWLSRDDQELSIDFPETGFAWNQLGQLAQKFYLDHSDLDWPALLDRLSRAKSNLVATITARSDSELHGQPPAPAGFDVDHALPDHRATGHSADESGAKIRQSLTDAFLIAIGLRVGDLVDQIGGHQTFQQAHDGHLQRIGEDDPQRVQIGRTARKVYRTQNEARADVFDYIERFYKPRRRHSKLGYISPMEFEARAMLT